MNTTVTLAAWKETQVVHFEVLGGCQASMRVDSLALSSCEQSCGFVKHHALPFSSWACE